jgi:transcriptional regulator with XRE-family HTH domain
MRGMTDAVHEWPLGERVLQARGEESQRAVAKRAGISPEMLWQIENGKRRDGFALKRPPAEIIMKVARAVGIPVAEALELAGYRPELYMPAEPFETVLARKMGTLRPEEQRALEILVDSLLVARGHLRAGTPSAMDVVVRSAGEDAAADVRSHGESVNGAAAPKQHQDD